LKEVDDHGKLTDRRSKQNSILGNPSVDTWLSRMKTASDEAAHNFILRNRKENFGNELLRVAEFYPHLQKLNTKALNVFRSNERAER
jgi:hypothetical protein